ncbi:MAG: 50S ribosomal protein L18 [Planctomycetota bacterium]|nr:50S ribosomal protein L18 [Planctomycetota bacterium]
MLKSASIGKNARQLRRKRHVRCRIALNCNVPRLSVNRTCKHISAQVICDKTGRTLATATTTAKALADQMSGKTKTERSAVIGAEIARKAKEAGVDQVVFDRGHSKYHGRVKALADAAREGGLKF